MSDFIDGQDKASLPSRHYMSQFLYEEMLYEFLSDGLQEERQKDLEDYLEECPDARPVLEAMKFSFEYTDKLSQGQVSPAFLKMIFSKKSLLEHVKYWVRRDHWPDFLNWIVQGLAGAVVIALLIVYVPWQKVGNFLSRKSLYIEVAQVETSPPLPERIVQKESAESYRESTSSGGLKKLDLSKIARPDSQKESLLLVATPDEKKEPIKEKKAEKTVNKILASETKSKEKETIKATQLLSANIVKSTVGNKLLGKSYILPENTESLESTGNVEKEKSKTANVEKAKIKADDKTEKKAKKVYVEQGFVYRVFMEVKNIEEKTPDLVSAIKKLGGRKAGKVEIGWKSEEGRYFHIVLPKKNLKALEALLRDLSPVIVARQPHRKVMPEGMVRLLIKIKDK